MRRHRKRVLLEHRWRRRLDFERRWCRKLIRWAADPARALVVGGNVSRRKYDKEGKWISRN